MPGSDDAVEFYLETVKEGIAPMSTEEEAMKYPEPLVEANLEMVVDVAKRHPCDVHVLDLILEGNNALMEATKPFPMTEGVSFAAHASASVEKAIAEAARNGGASER